MFEPTQPDEVAAALARHGEVEVRVGGPSMAPTVAVGARVRVRVGRPRAGEVALFRAGDGFLLHRLIARLPGGRWVHVGDAPGATGGLCHDRDLLGVAELPARLPPLLARLRLVASALGRALGCRLARPRV